MSKGIQLKIAIVTVLAAAAVLGEPPHALTSSSIEPSVQYGLLAFGVFNVFLALRGTAWVRGAAVVCSLVALVAPVAAGDSTYSDLVRAVVVVAAWLIWPPVLLVAWALARQSAAASPAEAERVLAARQARVAAAAVIGSVAVASIVYRIILGQGLQQSAALFIGVPALLAIVVIFAVSPRSATGVACKAVTVGLLVSLIFLGEGMLCVVMSAPLFYAVAVGIGAAIDMARRRLRPRASASLSCLLVLALIPMSMEGVTDATSFDRDERVYATRIIDAPADQIQRALFEPPRFDRPLPLYLRAGFPRPIATGIERTSTDTRWVIRFRGGEMRLNGIEPREGDLVLQLQEARPGLFRWRALSDDSHMTHFLEWRDIAVSWEPIDMDKTRVTWTLRYRRGLDPAWYFGPWERYAARLAAGYLIDAVATP